MNNRRDFIINSMAGVGAYFGLSPLSASWLNRHKNSEKELNKILGQGDFTYKLDKNWASKNKDSYSVQHCHEMIMDKTGRLIMTTTHTKNNILIFNKDGDILDSWTGNWPGAHGLNIQDEGGEEVLFITDPDINKVFKTTMAGKVIMTIQYPQEAGIYNSEKEFKPTETVTAPNGDIYVADGYGLSYIIVYDENGNYKHHFGGKGDGDDQFDCPHGITIDTRGGKEAELLITSRSKNEFKRFTMDGKHIETIKMPGYFMCRPVIKNELLYFAILATETWESYDGMIAILDAENKILSLPGSTILPSYTGNIINKPKCDDNSFLNPHDVCIDNDENIYVPQWQSGMTFPFRLIRV